MTILRSVTLLLLAALAGCVSTTSPEATKPSWDRGYMYAIGVGGVDYCGYIMFHETTATCQQTLSATAARTGKKIPAIVFLHNCSRIANDVASWLAGMGYVVFAPDSFARKGRVAFCESAPPRPDIYAMRTAELTYAREQLTHFDWIDQSRVFAVGVSEGGLGVSEHSGTGFRAKVILSYGCANGDVAGSAPVLNLVGELDDWNQRVGNRLCSVSAGSRAVHVPNNGHLFIGDKFATQEITAFLARFN